MSSIESVLPPVGYVSPPDGSISNPFTDLNVKRVPINIYHKIKENRQNVVTQTQFVDGVIIIDGVNTIL